YLLRTQRSRTFRDRRSSRAGSGRERVPTRPRHREIVVPPRVGSMTISIGAHVAQDDPIAEARARETTLVQFFLGDPQGYRGPEVRYAGGAARLKKDAEAAGVDLYVHAPYIVNVATT